MVSNTIQEIITAVKLSVESNLLPGVLSTSRRRFLAGTSDFLGSSDVFPKVDVTLRSNATGFALHRFLKFLPTSRSSNSTGGPLSPRMFLLSLCWLHEPDHPFDIM